METSVQKALNVLEVLFQSGQPRKLTELARQLNLSKPNVYRVLATLVELGFVRKDSLTSLYTPTLKVWELGSLLDHDNDLVPLSSPFLRELCAQTGECTQLAVTDNDYSVCVNKFDAPGPLSGTSPIGARRHTLATSTGKVLLAWAPAEYVKLAMLTIKPFTPNTVKTLEDVELELEQTRKRGYAVNWGEWRHGIAGISAPVRDRAGVVIAAIGVWGAETSILGAREDMLADAVVAAGRRLSLRLGYEEPKPG
jgi:IclR family KDG regulon transcriptional repressor